MKINQLHDWDVDYHQAVAIQNELVGEIRLESPETEFEVIAGADISYAKRRSQLFAGVVLLRLPDLQIIERVCVTQKTSFPYIPGLLTFREAPVLCNAFQKLQTTPDVAVFDGHGIAHPRGIGLASHMGLLLDIATIGCAKKNLVGSFQAVGGDRGDFVPIVDSGRVLGWVLRSREKVKPIFISPGHKVDLYSSLCIIFCTITRFRIPEATRQAHLYVNQLRSASV